MKRWAWRRVYAVAMVASGLLLFFGVRTGWPLAAAKRVSRENAKRRGLS